MEHYDSRMARRVWDRVLAQPEQPQEKHGQFLLQEKQALADYLWLSRRYPELAPLIQDTKDSIACLRGMLVLRGSPDTALQAKHYEGSEEAALQRCFFQSRKAAQDYAALAQEPEFGWAYTQLAEQRRRHCRILLQLLGRSGAKQTVSLKKSSR